MNKSKDKRLVNLDIKLDNATCVAFTITAGANKV